MTGNTSNQNPINNSLRKGFVLFAFVFAVLAVTCPIRAAAADGYWKLRRTVVYKPEYSNQHQPGEAYWQEVINANVAENEQSAQVKSYHYLGGEDVLTSELGAVSKCDSPPETIKAGEKIKLHFSMNVSFTEYTYDSSVIGCEYSYFYDSPDYLDKHPGNRSGIDAEPVTAGGPIKCYFDSHPDPNDPGNVDTCDVYTARARNLPRRSMEDFLNGIVPKRLGQTLVKAAGIELSRAAGALTRAELDRLTALLTGWVIPVTGTQDFDQAQVTAGGASLKDFDARTLRSLRCPGLFAAGEVLDVDGDCGGFNLQWAWSSALMAAQGINDYLTEVAP